MVDEKIVPRHYSTAVSLTAGQPDKLCDQIAEAILDAVLGEDPWSRVDCQVTATTGLIHVSGELKTDAFIAVPDIVRHVIRDAGFNRAKLGFDADTCGVVSSVAWLGKDISEGLLRTPEQITESQWDRFADFIGADEQVTVVGFACSETPELIPLPAVLAHQLCRQLDLARKERLIPFLRPDGGSQVTVEYEYGWPKRVASVVISTQHGLVEHLEMLEVEVLEKVVRPAIPGHLLDGDTQYLINPRGRSMLGGPMRHPGASGRQGIVDGYGSSVGACGPSFVGKDPMWIRRCGAYMARHVAKNVVAAGLADRFRIEITYAPGIARPVAITVDGFGTERVPLLRIQDLINRHFDMRPASIMEHLKLRRPIYRATAIYGGFGRADIDAPWEETDHVEWLRSEAKLKLPQELFGLVSTELHGPLGTKSASLVPVGLLPFGRADQLLDPGETASTSAGQRRGPEASSLTDGSSQDEQSSGKDLRNAKLEDADLSGADLRGTDLRGASLARANLAGANLSGCKLEGANLTAANFSSASLASANLSRARLADANLTGADLSHATLIECNLQGADLTGATLRNANLCQSTLLRTCLRSADLTGADLCEAVFFKVDFSRALLEIDQLRDTTPPDGVVRCPVCLEEGGITDVRLFDEDFQPLADLEPDGNLPEMWPCNHFAANAWRFFWPNGQGSGNDWLFTIGLAEAYALDMLPGEFPNDLREEAPSDVFSFGPHEDIEDCFYHYFDIVRLERADRWGSLWILPFVDGDDMDALRRGWQDVVRLFEELENPFKPRTDGWKAFEDLRDQLIRVGRAFAHTGGSDRSDQ